MTLDGTVESWSERNLSAEVAKGVDGVTELVNEIEVDYAVDRADAEIIADIEARLQADVLVDEAGLLVRADEGEVVLTGKVASAAQKRRARADAWVTGVRPVAGVVDAVAEDRLRKSLRRDPLLEIEIERRLDASPDVDTEDVEVTVSDGVATLVGTVDTWVAKRAATRSAYVGGAAHVVNGLVVSTL